MSAQHSNINTHVMPLYSKENFDYALEYDFYHVLIVGATGVGKTALASRIVNSEIPKYHSSPGYMRTINMTETINDKILNIMLCDMPGTTEISDIVELFDGVCVILLVFDVLSRPSFEIVPRYVEHIKKSNCPIFILIGNKSDERDRRVIKQLEALLFADENKLDYFEVSAVTSLNVDYLMSKVIRKLHDLVYGNTVVSLPRSIDAFLSDEQFSLLMQKKDV